MMKRYAQSVAWTVAASVLLAAGWLWPIPLTAQELHKKSPVVTISSNKIANGSVLLVQVDTGDLASPVSDLRIKFKKSAYPVYPNPVKGAGAYYALIGIPYRTKPGAQKLTVKFSDFNGNRSQQIPFHVVLGEYRTDILKVDSRRVDPNKRDRQRANREHQEVKHIYASSIKKLWQGPFVLPVESEISSQFGNRRIFNGKLKSYHNGLDFRSPVGTPVRAANTGIVRIAKGLFYSGNAIIIDHGTEIFTIYAHLSKVRVKAGQRVEKNQLIGLTGATGRVSGPHLHWGVKVKGIAVSPLQFVEVLDGLLQQ